MAVAVQTGSVNPIAAGSGTFNGSATGVLPAGSTFEGWFEWGYASFNQVTTHRFYTSDAAGEVDPFTEAMTFDLDRTARFRAKGRKSPSGTIRTGANVIFKTYAASPVHAAMQFLLTTPCSIGVMIQGWRPNTVESTATMELHYRASGDTVWILAASQTATGSADQTLSHTVTGLTPGVTYEFRSTLTRTTANENNSVQTDTEATTASTITTDPASGLTSSGATLESTVNPMGATLAVYFEYGLTTAYGTVTADQDPGTGSSPVPVDQAISGLSQNTTYHFRAVFRGTTNCTVNGADRTFVTLAAGGGGGKAMPIIIRDTHRYGIARDVFISLEEPNGTNNDRFITAAAPFAAGDVKISKDGGALANVTNLPTQVTAALPLYKLSLTAAEAAAQQISVIVKDQDGPAFRDALIVLEVDRIDLLLIGTAQAGGASTVTLPAAASAIDDYYNEHQVTIIGGLGQGQARMVTDYNGATKVATVNRAWSTNPDATSVIVVTRGSDVWYQVEGTEPAAGRATTPTRTPMFMIGKTWRRFLNKVTQTASAQTIMKDDAATTDVTGAVSNDGVTVTKGHLS